MQQALFDKLVCPVCRTPQGLNLVIDQTAEGAVIRGTIVCIICHNTYPIEDRIPILLPRMVGVASSNEPGLQEKRRQVTHFDSIGATELEVNRPHGCGRVYNFLLQTKIDTALSLYANPIAGRAVLDVCCGSGMDAEFLCRAGARVVGVDISLGALCGAQERARRYGLQYDLIVADAECLPFRDRAFEVAFVHDGLHHLSDPRAGLAEMLRVAEKAALITEPARALATAVGVRVGIAEAVEESGNRVHRFAEGELRRAFAGAGYNRARFRRYAMFYRQKPLLAFRLFESAPAFAVFRGLYQLLNLLVGRWGNKMAAVAER